MARSGSGVGTAANKVGRILVIDHRLPFPDRDSGSVRMMEMIRAISRRGHHLTFVPDNMAVFSPYLEQMQRHWRRSRPSPLLSVGRQLS